ncbi:MAG: hypothetical protein HOO88_00195 [Kiritimatiellaceae bacterium]|nr:hypothetical protein [Kiritimatiellaceae bacterium]
MNPYLKDLAPYRGSEPLSHELLILNESFYIEDRDCEIGANEWYSKGVTLLDDYERQYVNYADIFRNNKLPDGRWKNQGCAIYRTLESVLRDAGFSDIHNMLDHCTLANCFLRPALNGNSLILEEIDIGVAKENLIEITTELNPKLIICASSKAYYSVVQHVELACPIVHTAHPACAWWNRDGGRYGRAKFVQAVKGYLSNREIESVREAPVEIK